VFHENFVAVAY